jgi:hypothetical protein
VYSILKHNTILISKPVNIRIMVLNKTSCWIKEQQQRSEAKFHRDNWSGTFSLLVIWAAPWQNQHSAFATSMDPDQPAHAQSDQDPCCSLSLYGLKANSMDPDKSARMRRLVLIDAGRKRIMLVLSCRGLFVFHCWFRHYVG